MTESMLDSKEAAEYLAARGLSISAGTLANWRSVRARRNGAQRGPRALKIEGMVRYTVADLEAWIEEAAGKSAGGAVREDMGPLQGGGVGENT